MSKVLTSVALIAAFIILLMLSSSRLFAQVLDFARIAEAQAMNRLPVTLSLDDDFKFLFRGGRFYGCIQDRTTKQRWTGWAPVSSLQRWAMTGEWPVSPGVPTTFADVKVCWPDAPASVGEPAYWSLHWRVGPVRVDTIDFERTNAPENIAGVMVAGEECGSATATPGYRLLPRLRSADYRYPVTRCSP